MSGSMTGVRGRTPVSVLGPGPSGGVSRSNGSGCHDSKRRGRDSNPRALAGCRFSRPVVSTAHPPLPRDRTVSECFALGLGTGLYPKRRALCAHRHRPRGRRERPTLEPRVALGQDELRTRSAHQRCSTAERQLRPDRRSKSRSSTSLRERMTVTPFGTSALGPDGQSHTGRKPAAAAPRMSSSR